MTYPPTQQPYQMPPYGDTQMQTLPQTAVQPAPQPETPSHLVSNRWPRFGRAILIVALIIGAAGFLSGGGSYYMVSKTRPVQTAGLKHTISRLQSQVSTLQKQVSALAAQQRTTSGKVTTLNGKVAGMSPTVAYVGRFASSCSQPMTNKNGLPAQAWLPCAWQPPSGSTGGS